MVIGAAGWGKTTAVTAWCRSRPTVWLRYEDHDGDPDRLRVSLFRAFRRHIATNPDHMGA